MTAALSPELASRFAAIALGHVEREYPNKPGHVLAGPEDARTPRALHAVFFGSFDWHSCVHGYWLLARILRRFPQGPQAGSIAALFDRQLTAEKVARECAYFAAPTAHGYERPYGWAWLLKLAAELAALPEPRWPAALEPLSELIRQRFRAFLPIATYPIRTGTHFNTAFALRLAADGMEQAPLLAAAERWYRADTDCPGWGEPGGDEFLSPALVEAECMRRLLRDGFATWFDRFLPALAERRPAALFRPAVPSDRSDGKIAHLDGLNLSRAWCFRSLAGSLPACDARVAVLREAAEVHLAAALPHLDVHYMGEHWLASFALLALDEGGDGA